MTKDQNGTWEMESNDNFEGYMKALGKGETRAGGRRGILGTIVQPSIHVSFLCIMLRIFQTLSHLLLFPIYR